MLPRNPEDQRTTTMHTTRPMRWRRIPDVLRDRCLNCLSYTHRLTTCRMPLWCLRCRAFWHLARDCKQPRILVSYASSGSGSRTALERRRARRLADQPLPAAHREPTRTTLSSETMSVDEIWSAVYLGVYPR